MRSVLPVLVRITRMPSKAPPKKGDGSIEREPKTRFNCFCNLNTINFGQFMSKNKAQTWTLYNPIKEVHKCERERERVEKSHEKQGNNRIVLNCLILKSCDLILMVRAWPTMPLAFMSRDKSRHSSSQISVYKKQVKYASVIRSPWLLIRIHGSGSAIRMYGTL